MAHIATCGHRVTEGITCSVDEGGISHQGAWLSTYGTYCHQCILLYYYAGKIQSDDMAKLIKACLTTKREEKE
jgi:hypothetical protein